MINLDFDKDWVNSTKERLIKIYRGEIPDRVAGYSVEGFDMPDPKKLYFSPELQFEYQIKKLHKQEELGLDVIPGVYPYTNCTFWPSLFGAEIKYPDGDWPYIKKYPLENIKDVDNLSIPDIRKKGQGTLLIKTLEYFMKASKGKINVGTHEGDGPLYLAFGLMGEKLLLEFYDHPDYVKKLLRLCSKTIIEGIRLQREITGVPMNRCVMSVDDVYIPEGFGGVFVGETYSYLLSKEMYREIVKPIDHEFFSTFGGGAIHTCGNHAHLFEEFADLPVSMLRFYAGAYDPIEAKVKFGKDKIILGVKVSNGLGGAMPTLNDLLETIEKCKNGGRFILGPNGYPENIRKVIDMVGKY